MSFIRSTTVTGLVFALLLGMAASAAAGGALTPTKEASVTITNFSRYTLDVFDGYATWSCDGNGHRKELVTSSVYIESGDSRTYKFEMYTHCTVTRGDFRIAAKGMNHSKYVNKMYNKDGANLRVTNRDISNAMWGNYMDGD